jgi:hypothetical protein
MPVSGYAPGSTESASTEKYPFSSGVYSPPKCSG